MDLNLLALAFTAGVVTFFNPCSFALLPAYLSFVLGRDESLEGTHADHALIGIKYGLMAILGFAVVFLGIGLLISILGSQIRPFLPPIMIAVGIILILLGVLWSTGRQALYLSSLIGRVKVNDGSFFLYGVAYATGSIGCVFPVFLMLVFSALSTGGFLSGMVVFLVYTLSMGMMMVVVSVAVALSKKALIRRFKELQRLITRISGIILVIAGSYILYYYFTHFL
jgi:cytochrome c biogenesis protein CcdA